MTIRTGHRKDFEQVMKFYYELIEAMKGAPFHPEWKKDIYPSRSFIFEAITTNGLRIAEVEGEIAGAMVMDHETVEGYDQVPWQVVADKDDVVIIHALGVSLAYQGQGIAKQMIEACCSESRKIGMKVIRLDVLAKNKPAQKLYEAIGFTYIGRLQLFYEDTGLTDFLLYELPL